MKMLTHSYRGVDLRKALRLAESLGCTIRQPHSTGDLAISHPRFPRSLRVSLGRKDSPRQLTCWLNRLAGGEKE
jgi:hypothetical protein